ncbi:glycosyltransferase [Rhodoglobus aureus]
MAPERVASMERVAQSNQALIKELGVPWFVSTAGLVRDHPEATWLPVCIKVEEWASRRIPLTKDAPVVVHAPSREIMKRSDLVDAALAALHEQGTITYRRISGVPNSEMPKVLGDADILVDSVGSGNYGVASCEGMAAGLVVVSAIDQQIAEIVRRETGCDLPIVHTEPDGVSDAIIRILDDRAKYQTVASDGLRFVNAFHSGARSAEALRSFLAT